MSSGLRIVKALTVTPAMVVSCNAVVEPHPTYAAGTTYAVDSRVIKDNVIWQSLQASNTGHTPEDSPAWWVRVSATNPWRMFDQSSSSQTTRPASLSVTLRPGTVVTALAAIGLTGCTSIRVRMISDTYGTVFDQTIPRRLIPMAVGWWEWFYGPRYEPISSYLTNLPSYADAQIVVDFEGLSDLGVGTLVLGTISSWGLGVRTGMSIELQSYSTKKRNEFGEVQLIRRVPSDVQKIPIVLTRAETIPFKNHIANLDGLPALWITDVDALYGFVESLTELIAYSNATEAQLSIQGFA